MAERQGFIDRVKGAARECYVVAAAVKHYERAVDAGNAELPIVPTKTSPRDLVAATDKVESTYLIRMWAEFETALRSYHRHLTGQTDAQMSANGLINWMAGVKQGRAISEDFRDDVHEVRRYRNYLVHDRNEQDSPEPVAIDVARTRLNTLLHCLPLKW